MKNSIIINFLLEMNESERFYKEYDTAVKNGTLSALLSEINLEEAERLSLLIPELGRVNPASLSDSYITNAHLPYRTSVLIEKHNRYTPPFFHTHEFFEIIYVVQGIAQHQIFKQNLPLHKGDLCLVSPSVYHSIYVDDDDSIILNIMISRKRIADIFYNTLRSNSVISSFFNSSLYIQGYQDYLLFRTGDDLDIQSEMLSLYSEQMQIDSYTDNIISGMLMVDFSRLVRLYQRTVETAPSAHQTEIYKNLISYLMENLNTVTLHDVAEQMNYSTAYCSRYIKRLTGSSFTNLLQSLRFNRACTMLETGNMSIQAISEQLGYENPENFMRAFKKKYHMTPSEYRLSKRDN